MRSIKNSKQIVNQDCKPMIDPNSDCYSKGMSEQGSVRVTIECDQAILNDIVTACQQAILACGFCFKGKLDIVEDEE